MPTVALRWPPLGIPTPALGWDPKGGLETENNRVQQELDQVKVFNADSQGRRGRIRDVVSAREILIRRSGSSSGVGPASTLR